MIFIFYSSERMIMCILQESLKLKTGHTKMIVFFERVNFQNQASQWADYFFDRKMTTNKIITKNFLAEFFLFEIISYEAQGVIIFIKSVTFGSKNPNPRRLWWFSKMTFLRKKVSPSVTKCHLWPKKLKFSVILTNSKGDNFFPLEIRTLL